MENELQLARSIAIGVSKKIYYCQELGWEKNRIIKDASGYYYHHFAAMPDQIKITLKNSLGRTDCLIFTEMGFTLSQNATFFIASKTETRKLTVTISGRSRFDPSES